MDFALSTEPCLSGYHPHPLYVEYAVKRQARFSEWKLAFCNGIIYHLRHHFVSTSP